MELFLSFFPNLLLVFSRLAGFFVTVPVFSTRTGVPITFRVGIAAFVALIVFFSSGTQTPIPLDANFILLIVRESLIGILLGFIAYLFFTVVQIAGAFIDMQMGFGIANVIDPMTGAQSPIFGTFKFIVAILLFLTFDAHHYLLIGIMDSYQYLPLDNTFFGKFEEGNISEYIAKSFGIVFSLAFQMAAPIVAAMFLVDVALGVLAKTAPQFNIFVVGMPLKIIVGLIITFLLVPGFITLFQSLFTNLFDSMNELLNVMRTEETIRR
jgi:flagellar biosynthetic protein FliR